MIEFVKKYKHSLITHLFLILSFLVFGLNSFHENIWYDEAYQMILNRYSFVEIIDFVSKDTSGPLYAILLKITTLIFGSKLYIGRLLSLTIFSVQFVLAFYPIRRLYNLKVSIIYSCLLLMSTYSFFASIEIRTYSIAMTSTVGAITYALLYLRDARLSDLLKYFIFSLCALYSHSYAMFSIFLLIIVTLVCSLLKKNRKKIILANLMLFICFIPWLKILISQHSSISSSFWIIAPNLSDIKETICNLFTTNNYINTAILILVIISTILSLKNKKELKSILFLLIPSIGCITFFYLWSIYKTPLFIPKYVVPVCGIIYLMVAKVLDNSKHIVIPLICILLMIPNFLQNFKNEKSLTKDSITKEMIKFINDAVPDPNTFYVTNEFGLGIAEYYFSNSKHYISQYADIYVKTPELFGKIYYDIDNISEDYIICLGYPGQPVENFNVLMRKGYRIINSQFFPINYNNGIDVYILKNIKNT